MHTILVVEDDQFIRESLKDLLESDDYAVVCAANGAEALALLASINAPSLILLDWQMPIMGGEAFMNAKLQESKIAQIPTLLVSAVAEIIDRTGISETIKKPFNMDDLLQTVNRYCDKSSDSVASNKADSI